MLCCLFSLLVLQNSLWLVKKSLIGFSVLTLYQKYCALLKLCLAGTASDSIKSNTSNQGFVFIK